MAEVPRLVAVAITLVVVAVILIVVLLWPLYRLLWPSTRLRLRWPVGRPSWGSFVVKH